MKWLVAFIALIPGLVQASEALCKEELALAWIEKADARADAMTALKAGDKRFKAVRESYFVVPGVSSKESLQIIKAGNFTYIEGAGDEVCSSRHAQLVKKADAYAIVYNQLIMATINSLPFSQLFLPVTLATHSPLSDR